MTIESDKDAYDYVDGYGWPPGTILGPRLMMHDHGKDNSLGISDRGITTAMLEPVKESMFDHASETVKALQKSYFRTVLHTITDPMLSTAEQGMIACLVRNSIEEFERALKLLGHP